MVSILSGSATDGWVSGSIQISSPDNNRAAGDTGSVRLRTGSTNSSDSGSIGVVTGDVLKQGRAGSIFINAGQSIHMAGGDVRLQSGDSLGANSTGGSISVSAGSGAALGGGVFITGGDAIQNSAGSIDIGSGNAVGGSGGLIGIESGSSALGSSGNIKFQTSAAALRSGVISLVTGTTFSANSGDLNLRTGLSKSVSGDIQIQAGNSRRTLVGPSDSKPAIPIAIWQVRVWEFYPDLLPYLVRPATSFCTLITKSSAHLALFQFPLAPLKPTVPALCCSLLVIVKRVAVETFLSGLDEVAV